MKLLKQGIKGFKNRVVFKGSFYLFFLVASTQTVKSQTCIVSGTTDGNYAPFDICASGYSTTAKLFSACADLYLSTEICYGTINSIQYWVTNTAGSPNLPIKIYMKTQAANTLTAGTYTNMLSGATLVYSNASQSWLPWTSVPGYQTFTLQTPFTYTTGNLIIIGEVDYNQIANCGQAPVFGYGTKNGTDEYWYNNSLANLLNTTGTVDKYRPGLNFSSIIVLPIELAKFTAEIVSDKVELEWATITETNNNFFTIERSHNGENFITINTIKGAGNSVTVKKYNSADENPLIGLNYYRLKQTDYNGNYKYSNVVSVNYLSKDISFKNLYPNPATDNVSFDLYSPVEASGLVQIMDITGRVIKSETVHINAGNQTHTCSLSDLSKGIYYLKVLINEIGYSHTSKIIKE